MNGTGITAAMATSSLTWAVNIGFALLLTGELFTLLRAARGPLMSDRLVALAHSWLIGIGSLCCSPSNLITGIRSILRWRSHCSAASCRWRGHGQTAARPQKGPSLRLPNSLRVEATVSALIDSVLAILVVAGSLLLFAASLGLARGRDMVARIQAVTKAGTVGVIILLLGAAIAAGNLAIFMRDLTAWALILIGAALASQILAETTDHSQD